MQNYRKLLSLAIEAAIKAGQETLKFYLHEFDVLIKDDHSPLTQADLESNRIINDFLVSTNIPVLSEENKLISYKVRKDWKQFWLVDPLDGTKEFINKRSEYTINIALVENGIPVLGVVYVPVMNTLYYSFRDLGSFKVIPENSDSVEDMYNKSQKLQLGKAHTKLKVIASRSHLSGETLAFIDKLGKKVQIGETQSYGSSLKLCMVAEGIADIYPRLGPTMEWDTAASHAIAVYAGCNILNLNEPGPLYYNKEKLLNPWFVLYNSSLDALIKSIL